MSATANAHHHNFFNLNLCSSRRSARRIHIIWLPKISVLHSSFTNPKYTTSHVPTHLGRSSEQEDIPKPPTNRPLHSRSRRNSNIPTAQHLTMVLRIRLARFGKKHSPFYNIVVAHARYVSNPSQQSHLGGPQTLQPAHTYMPTPLNNSRNDRSNTFVKIGSLTKRITAQRATPAP